MLGLFQSGREKVERIEGEGKMIFLCCNPMMMMMMMMKGNKQLYLSYIDRKQ